MVHCKLVADRRSETLIGAQVISGGITRGMLNGLTLAIAERVPLRRLANLETAYSPAVGMDPIGGAVARLVRKLVP